MTGLQGCVCSNEYECTCDAGYSSAGGGAKVNGPGGFPPSEEQLAIRDAVANTERNIFVNAGAGCGKTTTMAWVVGEVRGRRCFVAFNSAIVKDIQAKVASDVDVLTMHALGKRAIFKAFGKHDVDGDNLFTIFKKRFSNVRDRLPFFNGTKKLISLAKGALASTAKQLDAICDDFSIDFTNGSWEALTAKEQEKYHFDPAEYEAEVSEYEAEVRKEAIALSLSIMEEQKKQQKVTVIDFDDMIWLPVVMKLRMPQYDLLVVDESQDTNACQLELLLRCARRSLWVGDPRQAIYGFRGADEKAVSTIINRTAADVHPLMTTFRCGKSIVADAQALVPTYKAGPKNHEGLVRHIDYGQVLEQVRAGDFVLSRTNAPLVALCMKALARGVRATMAGRDIGKSLTTLIKKMKATSLRQLAEKLLLWKEKEVTRLENKVPVPASAVEGIKDRVDTILAFIESGESRSVTELVERVERMFSDDDEGSIVMFSSTHRAKGRERERVFLLRDTFCRERFDEGGEPIEMPVEEENLLYVAITRAKQELVYVHGLPKKGKGEG